MGKTLISLNNVFKAFDGLKVLDGVDLTIEEGVVTTIIGRSGVGKSVLLKHIIGLLEPDRGEILYQGTSLARLSSTQRRALKRKLSYMFQNMALFDSLTVYENIALPLEEKSRLARSAIRARVMAKIDQLDLTGFDGKYPSQLSGGMRKRVALARALITEPEIVLFDEPTTGLDPVRRNAVHAMISRYQSRFGFTAVVVSHDIPEVFGISQKVAMLENGRIVFEGTSEEIRNCSQAEVQRFIQGIEDPSEAAQGVVPEAPGH